MSTLAASPVMPARSRTALSGTPVHSPFPMAPFPLCALRLLAVHYVEHRTVVARTLQVRDQRAAWHAPDVPVGQFQWISYGISLNGETPGIGVDSILVELFRTKRSRLGVISPCMFSKPGFKTGLSLDERLGVLEPAWELL